MRKYKKIIFILTLLLYSQNSFNNILINILNESKNIYKNYIPKIILNTCILTKNFSQSIKKKAIDYASKNKTPLFFLAATTAAGIILPKIKIVRHACLKLENPISGTDELEMANLLILVMAKIISIAILLNKIFLIYLKHGFLGTINFFMTLKSLHNKTYLNNFVKEIKDSIAKTNIIIIIPSLFINAINLNARKKAGFFSKILILNLQILLFLYYQTLTHQINNSNVYLKFIFISMLANFRIGKDITKKIESRINSNAIIKFINCIEKLIYISAIIFKIKLMIFLYPSSNFFTNINNLAYFSFYILMRVSQIINISKKIAQEEAAEPMLKEEEKYIFTIINEENLNQYLQNNIYNHVHNNEQIHHENKNNFNDLMSNRSRLFMYLAINNKNISKKRDQFIALSIFCYYYMKKEHTLCINNDNIGNAAHASCKNGHSNKIVNDILDDPNSPLNFEFDKYISFHENLWNDARDESTYFFDKNKINFDKIEIFKDDKLTEDKRKELNKIFRSFSFHKKEPQLNLLTVLLENISNFLEQYI